jgi:hypothetical protein
MAEITIIHIWSFVALEKRWRFVTPLHVKDGMPAQVYVGDPEYPNKNDQRRY